MTVGMPDREYHMAHDTKRRYETPSGAKFITGTMVMGNCTRKAYKLLKRNYKRGGAR